ncbi:MAG: hypothetical protein SP1CHLAM54_16950 [Chlamydiia bacterium]|nr:hypothetical protein [Chlamydiia bacterium]MCH9616583.1 hypothetical protein [Chlamydiia bacterium]MCH9629313.1 hypothetical protein [Chlamydiia bacterium]
MKLLKERGNPALRWLDRYVGIGLLFVLSVFRRKKRLPEKVRKVGVLKFSGIGDVVLLARSVQALKKQRPDVEIVFFSGKENAGMAPFVGADKHIKLSVFSPFKTLSALRQEQLDVLIDAEPWSRISALFTFFSRAKYRIGFKTKGQHKHGGVDWAKTYVFKRHEMENFASLFEPLGVEKPLLDPIHDRGASRQEKLLVVHLLPGGSRGYLKQWPKAHWQTLFRLLEPLELDIVATGAKKDFEAVQKVIEGFKVRNLCGMLPLKKTAELLGEARLVLSVDTGIMHLATAFDVPTIALHGPTSPNRWGGVGKYAFPITPTNKYAPCIQLGFENRCKVGKCMGSIAPERVLTQIQECLKL